jgi:hypothetical protein
VAFLLGLTLALSLFGRRSLSGIVLGRSDGVGRRSGSSLDLFRYALFDRFLFALFLLLLFGRLCDLDNDDAAVELFLVQKLCSLLGSLEGIEGDKAVPCRALAAVDDLSGKAATRLAPGRGRGGGVTGARVKKWGEQRQLTYRRQRERKRP